MTKTTQKESNPNILVLGLGNTLLQDEGVGIEAIQRLSDEHCWPDTVTMLDGSVMGLELLPYVELADAVLVLDAVRTGDPPGTLTRLENDEIPAVVALRMSMHQIGLQETLAMCQFRDTLPQCLVLWGVVPANLDLGISLSPVVAEQVDALVTAAVNELAAWGVVPTRC